MKYVCCLIAVEDMERSKAFYRNVLKQKIKYDFGKNVLFEDGFALHLKSHFSSLIGGKTISKGGNNFELYFEFDDIESFFKELNSNNVIFVHTIKEQPWRQRVVRFYDPDMNIIEVGESLEYLVYRLSKEGKTEKEISVIVGVPEDFVKTSLEMMKSK